MLRLFVAVDLPTAEQQAVAGLCTSVQGARWAKPHQLHITLRFMGQTPDDQLPLIRQRLAAVKASPFRLALSGVGVFPAARKPRVLWLGLQPAEPLIFLKREIDAALGPTSPADPDEEKRDFHPHLTLARFTRPPGESLARFLAQHDTHRGVEWEVDCFRLYRSTLHPSGAVHEPVAAYPLTWICRDQGIP